MKRGIIVLAAALMIGSAAAFTWTEKLKLETSPIGVPRFDRALSPDCGCRQATARVSFLLRRRDRLDVTVVDDDGDVVRTLADDIRRRAGRVELAWNGKDAGGRIVPEGDYRIRVRLLSDDRTIFIPTEIHVNRGPTATGA